MIAVIETKMTLQTRPDGETSKRPGGGCDMKRLFVTVDLENDYAGYITEGKTCHAFCCAADFLSAVRERQIKLTTFVTGELLDKRSDIIERFHDAGSEFGVHAYSHEISDCASEVQEILRATKAYADYFGVKPQGYRAPFGRISAEGLNTLADSGYQYDSSIHPSFIPGYCNNLASPTQPHHVANGRLLEIPISVLPYLRIPLSFSYWHFIGIRMLEALSRWTDLPQDIIAAIHLHDIGPTDSYYRLPILQRVLQIRGHYCKDLMGCLDRFLAFFISRGYQPSYMHELLKTASRK